MIMNFKRALSLAAASAMLMSISGVLPVSARISAIEASAAAGEIMPFEDYIRQM